MSENQQMVGSPRPGFRFNPRVAVLLVVLAAGVCGVVIAADRLSPRTRSADEHRQENDATTHGVSK